MLRFSLITLAAFFIGMAPALADCACKEKPTQEQSFQAMKDAGIIGRVILFGVTDVEGAAHKTAHIQVVNSYYQRDDDGDVATQLEVISDENECNALAGRGQWRGDMVLHKEESGVWRYRSICSEKEISEDHWGMLRAGEFKRKRRPDPTFDAANNGAPACGSTTTVAMSLPGVSSCDIPEQLP